MSILEWFLVGSLLVAAAAGLALSVVTREPGGWYQWGSARRKAVQWLFWIGAVAGLSTVASGLVVIVWRVAW